MRCDNYMDGVERGIRTPGSHSDIGLAVLRLTRLGHLHLTRGILHIGIKWFPVKVVIGVEFPIYYVICIMAVRKAQSRCYSGSKWTVRNIYIQLVCTWGCTMHRGKHRLLVNNDAT